MSASLAAFDRPRIGTSNTVCCCHFFIFIFMLISFCLHDEQRTERKVKILAVVKLLVVVVVVVECKSLKSNAKFNLIDTRRRAHTMLVQFILCKRGKEENLQLRVISNEI